MHGKNYYLKGVFTTGPIPSHAPALFNRLMEICDTQKLNITLMFEYIPIQKVLSIPNDATAHIRGKRVSAVAFCTWDEGGKERLDEVRAAARELVDMILEAEKEINEIDVNTNTGYGNYSKILLIPRWT